ncbi:hypothetical protein SNEBB_010704 [Seison nebaliae]|nr:hypothetical protein SNEBB_010704 [Seison nebaliae]
MIIDRHSKIVQTYLLIYNLLSAIGWLFVSGLYGQVVIKRQSINGKDAFVQMGIPLMVVQSIALLEIVHASLKLVRSNPIITAFQVFSRLFVGCFVLYFIKDSRSDYGLLCIMVAWALTEIIRYLYYVTCLLEKRCHILEYLRYTLFIVLYPLGVTGELLIIYSAYQSEESMKFFNYPMPNQLNISINFPSILVLVALGYPVVFPKLYFHMFRQRCKILCKKNE